MEQSLGIATFPEPFEERTAEAAVAYLRAAQSTMKTDRQTGLAALNQLFRSGRPPLPPLDGRYAGELVALDIAPVLTRLTQAIAGHWMPWLGKIFDEEQKRGDNVFSKDSLKLSRVFWPFYRGYVGDRPSTYRAFSFRTCLGPGLADPDREVLKVDYDLPANPRFTIRRVLDELAQVADGFYLGKAHLKWWWGKWQLVAYFSLAAAGR